MMISLWFVFFCVNIIAVHPDDDPKIVGGLDTDITIYPYQLSLQYLGEHSCGAALIAPTWALTAAHCTDGAFVPFLSVRAGSSLRGRGGIVVGVRHKHQHQRYSATTIDYDVALLELDEAITSDYAEIVPLPTANSKVSEGQMATVTGWGTETEDGRISRVLKIVEVPIVSNADCQRAYKGTKITKRMFCAGFVDGGKDACQGDSGGPAIVDGVLAGIVSWGYGCARPKQPGVYTNVAAVRDYIKFVSGV